MFEIGYSDDLKKMRVKKYIPSYLFENKKNKKIHGCSIVKNKKKLKNTKCQEGIISRNAKEIEVGSRHFLATLISFKRNKTSGPKKVHDRIPVIL